MNNNISNFKMPDSYPIDNKENQTNQLNDSINHINNSTIKETNSISSKLELLKNQKEKTKNKKVTWTVQVTKSLDKRISLFMIENNFTRTEAIEFLLDNALIQLNETSKY